MIPLETLGLLLVPTALLVCVARIAWRVWRPPAREKPAELRV